MDRRISLLRAAVSTDDFNAEIETWGDIATVWAAVDPVRDGERWRAGETLASKKMRFTIRWSRDVMDVDARDRVMFEGRTYDIDGVKETGRRDMIEITATARAEMPA